MQSKDVEKIYDYELNARLKEHFYIPLLIDTKQKAQINYAIKTPSEVEFLQDLEHYLQKEDNALKEYEWTFSRLVENIDYIYIPYFDCEVSLERKFYPDFIFWLRHKQSKAYKIIFIDPKGLKLALNNTLDKLKGFQHIFEGKKLNYEGQELHIKLVFYNKQNSNDEKLEGYVSDEVENVFVDL